MSQTEQSKSYTHPANNFDCVRIVAASLVLFSHHFALTAQPEPTFFQLHSIGGMAVLVFFSLSGYLVTQSWFADPNAWRFAARRALRIWPALTLVVVLTVLCLGPLVTTLPISEYLKHRATWDYLKTLRMAVHYVLPGVFETNPYPHGVNGSLWTIPLEVRCYIALGVLGLLGMLKRRAALVAFAAAYFIWYTYKSSPDLYGKLHYGRELSAYFLAGAVLNCTQNTWSKKPILWLGFALGFSVIAWLAGLRYMSILIALPCLVIWFGRASTPVLHRAGRWGDPSYGLYLFAFPIQQTVILTAYPALGFFPSMLVSFLFTSIAAYSSWHLVEKRALRLKPSRKLKKSSPTAPL